MSTFPGIQTLRTCKPGTKIWAMGQKERKTREKEIEGSKMGGVLKGKAKQRWRQRQWGKIGEDRGQEFIMSSWSLRKSEGWEGCNERKTGEVGCSGTAKK